MGEEKILSNIMPIIILPLIIAGAYILDILIGDPLGRYHPICLIGALIDWLKKVAFKMFKSPLGLRLAGGILALIVIFTTYKVTYVIAGLGWWAELVIIYFTLSIKSLLDHLDKVQTPLLDGKLEAARKNIGMIVGRDVSNLSEKEVSRAGIETGAESFCDGIMAPLFFAAIGGAPLAMVYKAVNTLDSMIGYNFNPYKDLGCFSARLDDVLNYIPARLSAFIFLLGGWIRGYNLSKAVEIKRKDAKKHPSPNAGQTESVMAGILEVRLGGFNYYNGEESFRSYMGGNERLPRASDLKQAMELLKVSAHLALILTIMISVLIGIIMTEF